MRKTKQKEILKKELDKIDSFFSAEELYEKVKDSSLSLATVYRFLSELKQNKKIYFYLCNRKYIYSTEKRSHCHFICEDSGKVIHFDIKSLDFLKDKIPGTIKSFQIEVKGCCDECEKD